MDNTVYFKNSQKMDDVESESVDLIITSPPYFNIKDYAKDGYQDETHSKNHKNQSKSGSSEIVGQTSALALFIWVGV